MSITYKKAMGTTTSRDQDPVPAFLTNVFLGFYYFFENAYRFFFPREAKDISKDVVLITGGANGLGRALAIRFAHSGAKVILWDIDQEALEDTAKGISDLGGLVYTYNVDITNRAAVNEAAEKVKSDVGIVSILVNNAGVVTGKSFLELTEEDVTRTFGVNAISHFWTTKAFLPDMMSLKKGQIVTIASLAGHLAAVKLSDYVASKHAAVGFTDALRMEITNAGYEDIYVTEVSPYYIDTPMFKGVEPGTIRSLEVDDVANTTMRAILTNEERVYIPFFFGFVVALKNLVPFKTMFALFKAMGECEAMMRFVGRAISGDVPGKDEQAEKEPKPTEATNQTSTSTGKPSEQSSAPTATPAKPLTEQLSTTEKPSEPDAVTSSTPTESPSEPAPVVPTPEEAKSEQPAKSQEPPKPKGDENHSRGIWSKPGFEEDKKIWE